MKRNALILLLLLTATINVHAQKPVNEYAAVDKKALQIPVGSTSGTKDIADYVNASFTTNTDKVRAIFIWTASNLEYDVSNMFALNFYERRSEKIDKALKTRKGICENYAAVFTDICLKAGLKSYVVEGYTKQNGFTDYIPHAWCATLIDTSWFLFDPTWGSGYVSDRQFVKRIDNSYFKAQPAAFIKSHMPFDLMWQFLYHPATVEQYAKGTTAVSATTNPFFAYRDSIVAYNQLTETEQMDASARRIEQNGISNAMIYDRLNHLKREVEMNRQNEMVGNYNSAAALFNSAVSDLNDFINYRNSQFSPKKPDTAIQHMVDLAGDKMKNAHEKIAKIKNPDNNTAALIGSIKKSMDDVDTRIAEQNEFLKKYFSKGALGRKTMFSKYTWMGMPLN